MRSIGALMWGLICFSVNSMVAQNAPVSVVQNIASTGVVVSIPITATGINNIGSCNLQLQYDPEIAVCTSVTKGTLLPGSLATNLNVPGVITIGWYTWPGVTLTDHTEIFLLNFSKITQGTTSIAWNEDYPDRQWSDGNSITLNDLPWEIFYFSGTVAFQDDAPVTTAPLLTSCEGLVVDVPVTVVNFNTIGALSLTMLFDSEVLTYQSFTNNSEFPGLTVFNPDQGIITASGFSTSSGVTLPNNEILFTLHFTGLEGSSGISFFDDGVTCEYTGPPPTYIVLNDLPQQLFYVDGSANINVPPTITSQPVSPDTVNAGSGTAIFNVSASGNDLSYHWQEFISSWNDLIDGGYYTGIFTSEMSIIDPPILMNGYKYRCIISNACEPDAITDGLATLSVNEYSGIVLSSLKDVINFYAYPNPFKNEIILTIQLPGQGELSIDIMDSSGRSKIIVHNSNVNAGEYNERINTEQLLPGLYLARIRLDANNNQITGLIKIVKME